LLSTQPLHATRARDILLSWLGLCCEPNWDNRLRNKFCRKFLNFIIMDEPQEITKRLSFGEVAQHLNATTQQLDVDDVIKALKVPSVENFQR